MSSLLRLAAQSLDRISNPSFGARVNENQAQLLSLIWDEDFQERLRGEAMALRHPDELTAHG